MTTKVIEETAGLECGGKENIKWDGVRSKFPGSPTILLK